MREMAINTTTRYQFTLSGMAIINNQITTSAGEEMEKVNALYTAVGMENGAFTWKIVWQSLQRFKIELPFDPANPLPGISPRELKTYVHRKT